MTYSEKSEYTQVSFISKLKCKLGKMLAKNFPLNSVRKFGIRMCGFKVGEKVYIGSDLIIASVISEKSCNLQIGNRVAIGPRVTLLLSSDANWSKIMLKIDPIRGMIELKDDCWLGTGVIIMPNVIIGKGAIVGAGSVVTRDVEENTVVAGAPARIIKRI